MYDGSYLAGRGHAPGVAHAPWPGGDGGRSLASAPSYRPHDFGCFRYEPHASELLGGWVDSLGNSVHVTVVDQNRCRLRAKLCSDKGRETTLTMQFIGTEAGGWVCGNAMLDPNWSRGGSHGYLFWLSPDGRISVWSRIRKKDTRYEAAVAEEAPRMAPGFEPQSFEQAPGEVDHGSFEARLQ